MIKEFTVNSKQELTDVCLQVYGTTQELFKLATDNDLEIDSDISQGDILEYDTEFGNFKVLEKIEANNLKMVNTREPIPTTGIGFMEIENDFIIG